MLIIHASKNGLEVWLLVGHTVRSFWSLNAAYAAAQCFAVTAG